MKLHIVLLVICIAMIGLVNVQLFLPSDSIQIELETIQSMLQDLDFDIHKHDLK